MNTTMIDEETTTAEGRDVPGEDMVERPGMAEERLIEEVRDLRRIVADALDFDPPRYVRSLLGPLLSWLPPHRRFSEFRILSLLRLRRAIGYLLDVSVPSILRRPATGGKPNIFLNPTQILHQADPGGRFDSFPDQAWFFINGIGANEAWVRMNGGCLVELFHRPITIIHNATDSIGTDLIECVLGKSWEVMSRPARRAYQVLHAALEDPAKKRVVVICHSQGTIIMANVLRALQSSRARAELFAPKEGEGFEPREICPPEPLSKTLLGKLEIYAFANCTDRMQYDPEMLARGVRVPWLESYGNEFDLAARLGMLAPNKEKNGIEIDGGSYVNAGKWGHLLNQHYLFEISDHLRSRRDSAGPYLDESGEPPRLYGYFGGQTPEPY